MRGNAQRYLLPSVVKTHSLFVVIITKHSFPIKNICRAVSPTARLGNLYINANRVLYVLKILESEAWVLYSDVNAFWQVFEQVFKQVF